MIVFGSFTSKATRFLDELFILGTKYSFKLKFNPFYRLIIIEDEQSELIGLVYKDK
jgi:hypothetical protein